MSIKDVRHAHYFDDAKMLKNQAIHKRAGHNAEILIKETEIVFIDKVTTRLNNIQGALLAQFNDTVRICKSRLSNNMMPILQSIVIEYYKYTIDKSETYRLLIENGILSKNHKDGYNDETTFYFYAVSEFVGTIRIFDNLKELVKSSLDIDKFKELENDRVLEPLITDLLSIYAFVCADNYLLTNPSKAFDFFALVVSCNETSGINSGFNCGKYSDYPHMFKRMAEARYSKDPKQKAKAEIKIKWLEQHASFKRGDKTQFAKDMQKLYPDGKDYLIKDLKTIFNWIKEWEAELLQK